jgi:hypothetical protein
MQSENNTFCIKAGIYTICIYIFLLLLFLNKINKYYILNGKFFTEFVVQIIYILYVYIRITRINYPIRIMFE